MKTKQSWLLTALVCASLMMEACLKGQHFEEPSVMNQPYTQLVQDPYFGDYQGTYSPSETPPAEGGTAPVDSEAKVIAQGDRHYHVTLQAKASDALGWPLHVELDGQLEGERVLFSGHAGGHDWQGEVSRGALKIHKLGYGGVFEMSRVTKKSPSEAAKPPSNAIVMLAYAPGRKPDLEQWKEAGWVTTEDGIMHRNPGAGPRPDLPRRDLYSKREFRNVRLHLEFRIPYEPGLREQARGNSGVIFADRYEVQVLDSYGIIAGTGDCGAIYGVAPPRVNAAFPPLSWQTYDITFHAPKMDGSKMVQPPRLTVFWNGIKVHENQTSPTPTGDPGRPNAGSGPLRIQDHGNLVYYRNIWLEELSDAE